MLRQTFITLFACLTLSTFSQEVRTFDGTDNNPNHPDWGSVDTQLPRLTTINYGDGFKQPGGQDWPNPREISNLIFDQAESIEDALGLSDFVWAFGQFLDHDITLVPDEENAWIYVQVPECDPWFDPFCSGVVLIPMLRSTFDPATGTDPSNPRQHINNITAFIDGSVVYGSTKERADWLRTFQGGKLKTSAGNLLPYNTIDGELNSDIDPTAPEMADPVGFSDKHFVAGDVRGNENALLLSFHTLFVREHNRLCTELAGANPLWDDEKLYQEARRRVGAAIQAIVYEEWLPAMGLSLPSYQGYDQLINPGISNVFSAAAFRLGHTLINDIIVRLDDQGETIPQGNLDMKHAFFNPSELAIAGGLEPYFRGMATQMQQECDVKMVNDLRNFLFGPPGAGGLDLASLNINRGRERGIPDFNTVRENFGLEAYDDFYALTEHLDWADKMTAIYETMDRLDAWVGMLAEDHVKNALFGETIMAIMKQQFGALRDGDRFYYENDPGLNPQEIFNIKHTPLSEIIKRNTNIEVIQENVFIMTPFELLCTTDEPLSDIAGNLTFAKDGSIVKDATVEVMSMDTGDPIYSMLANGNFEFVDMETCEDYMIRPSKDSEWDNGVTTIDLVLIRKDILGIKKLDSPYKILAGDINRSGSLTTIDLVQIQKIILNIITDIDDLDSWRFVPKGFEFTDPSNPFLDSIPNSINVLNLQDPAYTDFVAFKMGDVNFSANPEQLQSIDDRTVVEPLVFQINDQDLDYGENVEVVFKSNNFDHIEGFQFTFNYDPTSLSFEGIEDRNLNNLSENNFHVIENKGAITASWVGDVEKLGNSELFSINFVSKSNHKHLRNLVTLNSRITDALAITQNLAVMNVVLEFEGTEGSLAQHAYELYQNQPNPFVGNTFIGFSLPTKTSAILTIYDVSGKTLKTVENDFERGYNEISINRDDLPAEGMLFYKLESEFGVMSKKMALL